MPHLVVLQPAAEREYAHLEIRTRRIVLAALRHLEVDPHGVEIRTVRGRPGVQRARAGSYRILFRTDDATRTVTVGRIAPRDKAYRKLDRLNL